jgi:hypothetical protein
MPSALCLHRLRTDTLFDTGIGADGDKSPCRLRDTSTTGSPGRPVPGVRIGTYVMNERMRKVIILAAMLVFSLLATQAILCLHLLCEEHQHQHDSQKCPICQQLLTFPRSITVEGQTVISQAPHPWQGLIFHIEVISAISTFRISNPRAPPFVR